MAEDRVYEGDKDICQWKGLNDEEEKLEIKARHILAEMGQIYSNLVFQITMVKWPTVRGFLHFFRQPRNVIIAALYNENTV